MALYRSTKLKDNTHLSICHGVSSDVCRHGVIFKKLGIGSLMLALKPVIGFENSIQVRN